MPFTINGIGTRYYGKKNADARIDVCEACGRPGALESYDATLCFCVVFVPLIPLGKKRILDECPSCRRHRVMKRSDYEALRAEALESVNAAFGDRLASEEALVEAIATLSTFGSPAEFSEAAQRVRARRGLGYDVFAALGDGHRRFDQGAEAAAAYRAALEQDNRDAAREALAMTLCDLGKPGEAREYLEHVFTGRHGDRTGYLLVLAESLLEWGQGADAEALVERSLMTFPELESEKPWRKLRKRVAKSATRGGFAGAGATPDQTAFQGGGGGRDSSPSGLSRKVVLSGGLLLVVVALLVALAWPFITSYRVHVVNGLGKPYTVHIGDETLELVPGEIVRVSVPGDEFTVRFDDPSLGFPDQTLSVKQIESDRLMSFGTRVLNPDRMALLVKESIVYSDGPTDAKGALTFYFGEALYTFDNIDYAFRDSPDQVQIDRDKGYEYRRVLYEVRPDAVHGRVDAIASHESPERALEYAQAVAPRCIDAPYLPFFLAGSLDWEAFLDLAAPHLEARPLRVEWHRAYQNVFEGRGEYARLDREYRALLDDEPENGIRLYLLGRLLSDPELAHDLFERATKATPPSEHAWYALSYASLANARFEDCLEEVDRALSFSPGNPTYVDHRRECLQGAGAYEELLAMRRASLADDPWNVDLREEEVALLHVLNRAEEADGVAAEILKEIIAAGDKEFYAEQKAEFEIVVELALRDGPAFVERLGQSEFEADRFYASLLTGELDNADVLLSNSESAGPGDHLLLALEARRKGRTRLARKRLALAVEGYADQSRETAELARLLKDGRGVPTDELIRLGVHPFHKRTLLAALAVWRPSDRERIARMARALNYHWDVTGLILDRALAESPRPE